MTALPRLLEARRPRRRRGWLRLCRRQLQRILQAIATRMRRAGVQTYSAMCRGGAARDSWVRRWADGSTSAFRPWSSLHFTSRFHASFLTSPKVSTQHARSVSSQGMACLSVLLDKPFDHDYITYLHDRSPFTRSWTCPQLVGAERLQGHGLVLPAWLRPFRRPLLSRNRTRSWKSSWAASRASTRRSDVGVVAVGCRGAVVLPLPPSAAPRSSRRCGRRFLGLLLARSALITDGL